MKKLMSVLLCLISLAKFTETNAQQGVQVGIILQPSLTTMRSAAFSSSSNDYNPDFNQTLRTSFGAYLDYHFTPYIGVGADILYAAQGQKFLVTNDLLEYESHYYKFNYLKIPLFLSYNSGGKKARLVGTIGPQLLVLASAKDHFDAKDHDILDSYAPLNLGFNFGIGIEFFLSEHLMLSIAPNFDIAFLNYNYTTDQAQPAYIGKSPTTTNFGLQFGLKYIKNEIVPEADIIKAY